MFRTALNRQARPRGKFLFIPHIYQNNVTMDDPVSS